MTNSADPDQLACQLIWIYTVCKDRAYPGSAGLGLNPPPLNPHLKILQNDQVILTGQQGTYVTIWKINLRIMSKPHAHPQTM